MIARWAPIGVLLALVALGAFVLLADTGATKFEGAAVRPLPAYALVNLNGEGDVTSQARAGRPYLINVFASWCTPCRAEHPLLMQLRERGVEIVGVAYKDRPDRARAFLTELGDPYTEIAIDPDGRFGLDLGIAGVPETFLIDAQGRITTLRRGPLTEGDIEGLLAALRDAD